MPKEVFGPNINASSRYEEFCSRVNEFKERNNWKKRLNRLNVRRYRSYTKLVGRRFYVSSKKYYIIERPQSPENDYLMVELIDFITKEIIPFDVVELFRSVFAINKEQYDVFRKDDEEYLELMYYKCSFIASNAYINVTLSRMIKERPNVSDKELVDTFLDVVGNGQIYFKTKEIYRHKYGYSRSRFLLDEILDVHCAYNTKLNRRDLEYVPGTIYEKNDAIKEVEDEYGECIDEALSRRDVSRPILAIGIHGDFSGRDTFFCFAKSRKEEDICWRFYAHYITWCVDVSPKDTNEKIREFLIEHIFRFFYKGRFKNRIEGSRKYHEGK